MEGHTIAGYFFPSKINQLQKTVYSPVEGMHRRQIRQMLAARIKKRSQCYNSSENITEASPHEQYKTQSRIVLRKKSKNISSVVLEKKSSKCKHIAIQRQPKKKLAPQNIGLRNLLQKAMRLKTQQATFENDPFFKILKKRNPLYKNRRTAVNQRYNQQNFTKQPIKYLFQNSSLCSFNEDSNPKLRAKSQTVTYYEIKNYYETKYGRQSTLPI